MLFFCKFYTQFREGKKKKKERERERKREREFSIVVFK
jgi:hypothetical protein